MQDVVEDTQGSVQRLEATCAAFREHSRGTTRICAPAQIWLDVLHTSVWGVYIIILYSEKRFRRPQSQRLLVTYASFLLMPFLSTLETSYQLWLDSIVPAHLCAPSIPMLNSTQFRLHFFFGISASRFFTYPSSRCTADCSAWTEYQYHLLLAPHIIC